MAWARYIIKLGRFHPISSLLINYSSYKILVYNFHIQFNRIIYLITTTNFLYVICSVYVYYIVILDVGEENSQILVWYIYFEFHLHQPHPIFHSTSHYHLLPYTKVHAKGMYISLYYIYMKMIRYYVELISQT